MPPKPPSHRHNPQHHLPSLSSCSSLKMRLQFHPLSLPSPLLTLPHPCLIFSTAYNPYAPAAPSRYTSDAALNPLYASPHPPNPLHHLPFLCSCIRFIGYKSGSEISDMVSSHELAIEVESLAHESNPHPPVLQECEHRFILNICNLSKPDSFVIVFISAQPPSSQKPDFKSYEKENTVEPCSPTEDPGQGDVIFSGEVEILSKEQFVSNITQTIPRLEKMQNHSKIPDYVHQKIAEEMSLLKRDLNSKSITNSTKKTLKMAAHNIWAGVQVGESLPKGSQVVIGAPGKGFGERPSINATKKTTKNAIPLNPQKILGINVEVYHIDSEPPHTGSFPYSMKQSMMKPLPPVLKIFKLFKKGRQLKMIQWVNI
ncbi:hypothetical protein O181_030152 [Austropuccinia psidii MF-1]|uniref:Uncharacterized protein n=1 Tax=Austropuccinia psidii MF-1 TaxID=1389203 RepID=A0A9Q3H458_9BASI|nr:hypothetical protein [Austropuccinia psidii MF-1]